MHLPEHPIEVEIKRESKLLEEMLLSTEFSALMDVASSSVILPSFPQMESAPRGEAEDRHAPTRDAVTSVVKEGTSGIVKQLLGDHAGEIVKGLAAEGAKQAAGMMVGPLLQIVLQATGSLAVRVKSLQLEVNQIQRRLEGENVIALATGLEQAAKALALPATNEDSSRFRVTRLHSALDNLDEAWVRAKTMQGSTSKQTQVIIRFAQGLCAVAIPGGVEAAKVYFDESLECLRLESKKLHDAATADRETIESIRLEGIGPTGEMLPDIRPEWEEKIVTYRPSFAMRVKEEAVDEYKMVKNFGNTRAERMDAYEQRAQRCSLAAARRDSLFQNVEALLQAASIGSGQYRPR